MPTATKYLIGTAPSSRCFPDWSWAHWGPYQNGSNLYAITTNQGGGSEYLSVMKSTDSGQTWTEQDSGNRPDLADQNRASCSVYAFGTTLRIYHTDPTASTLAITDFNMSTDTFGSTDVSAVSIAGVADTYGGVSGVRRTTGVDVITFQGPDSAGNGVAQWVWRNSPGAWVGPVDMETGVSTRTIACCLGANHRVHIIYEDISGNDIKYFNINSLDVSSVPIPLASGLHPNGYPYGAPLVVGSNIYVPYAVEYASDHPRLEVLIGTDVATPVWTLTRPADDRVSGYGNLASSMAMASVGGTPWLIFTTYTSATAMPCGIYVTQRTGGAWSTPQELVVPDALTAYQGITAYGISSTEAGVVFGSGFVLYYAACSLTAAAAAATYARGGSFGG